MTAFMHNRGYTETQFNGNDIRDVHYASRWQNFNENHSSTWTLYFYDNRIWQPEGLGSAIYVHASAAAESFQPVVWCYQNTHTGGERSVYISLTFQNLDSLKNVRFLNNLFSSNCGILSSSGSSLPLNWAGGIGLFDYNYVRNQGSTPVWWGSHNTQGSEFVWDPCAPPSDWLADHAPMSISAGLDICRSFTVGGQTYAALPGMTSSYYPGPAPVLGSTQTTSDNTPAAPDPTPKDYYVSITGSDSSGDGSQAKPWRTIGKAALIVNPGDTVNVLAGIYNEQVTLTRHGTATKRIVIQGQRGPNGEWLTIIDPSVEASSGWIPAPEIGRGVYKNLNLPFEPAAVIAEGKNLECVPNLWLSDPTNENYQASWDRFAYPADHLLSLDRYLGWTGSFPAWDGIEGLWGWANGAAYIRFRNGDDPNWMNIRISDNEGGVGPQVNRAGILLRPAQYNTIRNLHVRGGYVAIAAKSEAGIGPSYSLIESNYLEHGTSQIVFQPDSPVCHSNIISHNIITPNRYGFSDMGAWAASHPETWPRFNAWDFTKDVLGSGENSSMITLISAGNGNALVANVLSNGFDGIRLSGESLCTTSPATGTIIASNVIHNVSMTPIMLDRGYDKTDIFANETWDFKFSMRWQSLNAPHAYGWTAFIHHNRAWNPPGMGSWVYLHAQITTNRFYPTIWAYHNTFSGGLEAVNFSTQWAKVGGLPNVRFLNNLFSSEMPFTYDWAFGKDPAMLGAFDYNFIRGTQSQTNAAWYGPNNILSEDPLWNTPSLALISDAFPVTLQQGVDLSRSFTLGSAAYAALPGMTAGYFAGSAPILGAVQGSCYVPEPPATTFIVSLEASDAERMDTYMSLRETTVPGSSSATEQYLGSEYPERGEARFHPSLLAAGPYTVWCRVKATRPEADSFYVSINGEAEQVIETRFWAPVWQWVRLATAEVSDSQLPADAHLFTSGSNQISFRCREANTLLSRVILTNDPEFVPAEAVASQVIPQIQQTRYGQFLKWSSSPGVTYRVFYSPDFANAPWTLVGEPIEAIGPETEWLAPASQPAAGFYWVLAGM